MKKGLVRKSLVAGIVALFVVMSVLPAVNAAVSSGQTQMETIQVELSVSIDKPLKGHLYVFNKDWGETSSGDTLIIGSITIKASASGEEWVNFSITGVTRFTGYEPPYEWDWKDGAAGTHLIKVMAYDGEGNETSESLNVKVIMVINAGEVETAEAMLAEAVASGDIDVEIASSLILNSYNLAADTSTNSK